MPRLARLDAPGVFHVIGRGIERRKIFLKRFDRNDFIARLAQLAEDGSMAVYAWALLPNHFHLLCKTKRRPLSLNMQASVSSKSKVLFHKFMEQVEKILKNLPKPLEWRSFYINDLPLLMDISEEVQKVSIQNGLNRSQTKAFTVLAKLRLKPTSWWSKFCIA